MVTSLSFEESQILLYKKTSFLFGVICGLCVAPILLHKVFNINLYVGFLVSIAVFVVGTSGCKSLAIKITAKTNSLLLDELEPELFMKRLMREICSTKQSNWGLSTILLVSQAYQAMGKFKEAEEVCLSYLNDSSRNKIGDVPKRTEISILAELVVLYSDAGRYIVAKKNYEEIERRLVGITLSEVEQYRVRKAYYCMLLSSEKYHECIDYFKKENNNHIDNLSYVTMSFRLAEVYKACGDCGMAKAMYQLVADNGKNLYVSSKSKDTLQML